MSQEELIKNCKEVLKKNNLHPLKKLGKGGFSILKQAENLLYSVKCINKKQFAKRPSLHKYIEQEIAMWRGLEHPNIVKLIRSFEDEGWIFMIMEYCNNGSLHQFQGTKEAKVFTLPETMRIAKDILAGLQYMHSKNLIHRDIKAENILITTNSKKNNDFNVKICDLGFCREDDENVNTFCGTTNYMAPQIFQKTTYDLKVDIWALGVLIFFMIFGDFPFKSLNIQNQINNKCIKGFSLKNYTIKKNVCLAKSDLDLLSQLFSQIFRLDASKRIGIAQILKYKWFNCDKSSSRNTTTESQSSEDEVGIEEQKISFLRQILVDVKKAKFLSVLEQVTFRYYINKIMALNIEGKIKDDKTSKKLYEEIIQQNEEYSTIIVSNLKKHPIQEICSVFSPKAKTFTDFKQPYRMVIGYVFSKAHKNISEDLTARSKIKLKLFCCHVINRVFQKQNRNDIFKFYLSWLKKEKKAVKFQFKTFQRWIDLQNSDVLVQTVQLMNDKFYKRSP